MGYSPRFDIEQAVLHPDIEVRAGVWTARMIDLHRSGWQFEVELTDFGRDTRVAARNPVSGLVGMFRIDSFVLRHQVTARALFFPEQLVMTNEHGIFQQMQIPRMEDMVRADVGMMIQTREVEFRILKPYDDTRSQDIIVTLDKVPMLLEEIRKAQEPSARNLLHKHHKEDNLQQLTQQAKILTFKGG